MVDQPPVFVVAAARSGTTALSHMLASELDLACSPETNIMMILKRIERSHPEMTFREFCKKQANHLMHGKNRPHSLVVNEAIKDERIIDNKRLFTDLIISMDSYSEGSHILEQTPRNGEHLRALRGLYPDSVILFLMRNPFDVVQSKTKTPWGSKNKLALFCVWALQYAELSEFAREMGRRRLIIVRYEKLDRAPYKARLIRLLNSYGVASRAEVVDIKPRNYDGANWTAEHFTRSVAEFKPDAKNKWTSRYPMLENCGNKFVLSALRSVAWGRGGFTFAIVKFCAWISKTFSRR